MKAEQVFVTFGGGNWVWRRRAARLAHQARGLGHFDHCIGVTDRTLLAYLPTFAAEHRTLLDSAPRGYGYWLWKPALVRALLDTRRPRLVTYMDAGCDFGTSAKATSGWKRILARADERGLLLQENEVPGATDTRYSKRDLLEYVGLPQELCDTQQIQATAFSFSNCPDSLMLVSSWYEVACQGRYHFLDDSPSSGPECAAFIAHRHDQSILSGLAKMAGVAPEKNWSGVPADLSQAVHQPVIASRNRGFFSVVDRHIVARGERALIHYAYGVRARTTHR